jgi:lysyl-tRNA synthetase class I
MNFNWEPARITGIADGVLHLVVNGHPVSVEIARLDLETYYQNASEWFENWRIAEEKRLALRAHQTELRRARKIRQKVLGEELAAALEEKRQQEDEAQEERWRQAWANQERLNEIFSREYRVWLAQQEPDYVWQPYHPRDASPQALDFWGHSA